MIQVNATSGLIIFRKGESLFPRAMRSLRLWTLFITFAILFLIGYATVSNDGYKCGRKLLCAALLRYAYLIALELLIKSLPCDPKEFRCPQFIPIGLKQRIPDARDLDLFHSFGQGEGGLVLDEG